VWRWIARALKLIPVDPDANLVPAMRAGAYGLRHGKVLVLYPEGERSIDGTPKTFKKGAAILATHLKVPIYPVALDGFHEAWPRGKKFQKFAPLRVAIGDPIYPPEHAANPEKAYDELTQTVRRRVVEMWNELHRELYPPAEGGDEEHAMAGSSSGVTRR
jgi:long-chain acyl-CoA synthetase